MSFDPLLLLWAWNADVKSGAAAANRGHEVAGTGPRANTSDQTREGKANSLDPQGISRSPTKPNLFSFRTRIQTGSRGFPGHSDWGMPPVRLLPAE